MSLITNTDTSILPYNDDYMVYDLDRRLYLLTEKAVQDLCGYNLTELAGTKTKADRIRYRQAQDVVNYIRQNSRIRTFKFKQFQIAKDEDTRDLYQQVLVEQMLYYIESGAGLLKTQHGVNINKGTALDLSKLRGNVLIAPASEILLYSSGLLYVGYLYSYNFEEDGTW